MFQSLNITSIPTCNILPWYFLVFPLEDGCETSCATKQERQPQQTLLLPRVWLPGSLQQRKAEFMNECMQDLQSNVAFKCQYNNHNCTDECCMLTYK